VLLVRITTPTLRAAPSARRKRPQTLVMMALRLVTMVALAHAVVVLGKPLLEPGFIAKHNSDLASTWVAGHNHLTGLSEEEFDSFMGSVPVPDPGATSLTEPWPLQAAYDRIKASNITLPKWFDPRDRWHWCASTSQIRDQGICGSCW
jgi:hypothetical protein